MKKLVTALIVILPIILLIALFAVTGIARIAAQIPATGISIANKGEDGIFFFDLADYKYPMNEKDLGVEVLPRIAHNRGYDLTITDLGGKATDVVTRGSDGSFSLNGTGLTKLTYTSKDGGYSDSVLFNVTASAPLSLMPTVSDADGNAYELEPAEDTDYKITLTSGKYTLGALYEPSSVIFTHAKYQSANSQILAFSDTNGHFNARFCGNTVVTVSADGAKGPIKKTIEVTVVPSAETTIDGLAADNVAYIRAPIGSKALTLGIQSALNLSVEDISIFGDNVANFNAVAVDSVAGAFNVRITLNNVSANAKTERYTLSLGGRNYDFFVDYANRDFNVYAPANAKGKGEIVLPVGSHTTLTVASNPHSRNIEYDWSIDDQAAIKIISENGGECTLQSNGAFGATLYIEWTEYDENREIVASGIITREVTSVHAYSAIVFAENADSVGLGGLAVASDGYDEDGNLVAYEHESKLRAYGKSGTLADIYDMEFSISDPSLASVRFEDSKLFVSALGDGDVTITATWKYGALFGIAPASFTFRAVKGIAANDDESIRRAFAQALPVVLTGDVYLGENLFEKTASGGRAPKYEPTIMREKLLSYTNELPTTADWTYYKNMGFSRPSVRYCLDVTADLHGNGHFISAQYITDMLDGTDTLYDFAVFRGPLDFVATSTTGIQLASVKGQDNIVFLMRTDGVTVDNAVLKGCDDETLYDGDEINLSWLNYVGTTLEIMADVNLTRSRVMNGRTVVRIFGRDDVQGDPDVQSEKINATIDGCVLQCAREFILKIGTNRVVLGDLKNPSPFLFDANGNEYDAYNSPACDGYLYDDYFMSNLVLTDVALKDSTLSTSGMLSIGIESRFAGLMLAGDPKTIFRIDGWYNLAGTSYPAALHLIGNVVINDWKDVRSVDSSTIVEADTSQSSLAFLALDVSQMLKTVQEFGGDKYSDITTLKGGKQLVHGGIAFYGGGKNYSVLDMSGYTGKAMKNYNINLNILLNSKDKNVSNQGAFLPLAAGVEDFRFILEYNY
ncbi:MAG: hypothetical protein NC037_05250 [Bacteroides sp.]|nr:hypothetical protein [Bacillota bacterium]MCM1393327.1 hypothetical protein [[Eubacterium] siraeum]MCM1455913.1 hypothetical protein [Bacteroides sp.]